MHEACLDFHACHQMLLPMLCFMLFECVPLSLCLCVAICVSAKQHNRSVLARLSHLNFLYLDVNLHIHIEPKRAAIILPM